MFKDYYSILEIGEKADSSQVKKALKRQALFWHPDRNSNPFANNRMQDINEAYLILKDNEARKRYDIEYQIFKEFRLQFQKTKGSVSVIDTSHEFYGFEDYQTLDLTLSRWMKNAKKQSFDMAKLSLEELLGMTNEGLKAAKEAFNIGVSFQFGCLVFFLVLLALFALTSK